jgi:large subunit ribosomal protein L23Ae
VKTPDVEKTKAAIGKASTSAAAKLSILADKGKKVAASATTKLATLASKGKATLDAATTKKTTVPAEQKKTSISKAKTAKQAALQGTQAKRVRKIRTSVTFRRPKTLRLARHPKYPRKSTERRNRLTPYSIIIHPLGTESAMKKIEDNNTLVFLCNEHANKHQIRAAVKKLYNIKALQINTLIRPDGKKKAYVRLTPDYDASDVAAKVSYSRM